MRLRIRIGRAGRIDAQDRVCIAVGPRRSGAGHPAALRAARPQRDLSLHGRWTVAGRHVRPQAAADRGGRSAVQDENRADAIQQQWQHARLAVEVSPLWRVRTDRQRFVSARRAISRRFVRGALDDFQVLRAHQRELPAAHRLGTVRAAEHGGVDDLRARPAAT